MSILLVLFAAMIPASAAADRAGWRYDVHWRGLSVGEATFARTPTAEGYRARWSMETQGLVAGFLSLNTEGLAIGGVAQGGRPRPERYRLRMDTKKRQGDVSVTYGADGGARSVENSLRWIRREPEDRDPPPVPPELRRGLDPASALVMIGTRVRHSFHGGPTRFRIPVYDGIRRYDFAINVIGLDEVSVWWRTFPAVELAAQLIPLAGFREPEEWQGKSIKVHLDPDTMLPRRIETATGIVITAAEPCETMRECRG